MRTPLEEQETIIRWYRTDDYFECSTSDTTMWTKFDKLVERGDWEMFRTETYHGTVVEKFYRAPVKVLSFGARPRATRELTEEEKVKKAERLRKARQNG